MKRIRLLVLAGAVAVALPLGLATANATGSGGTSVSIKATADYDTVGAAIDVGLYIRCYGGSGVVVVELDQPASNPYPAQHHEGSQIVNCNGQTHSVAVTLGGFGGYAGPAKVKATLTSQVTKVTTASRWVTVVQ